MALGELTDKYIISDPEISDPCLNSINDFHCTQIKPKLPNSSSKAISDCPCSLL